MTPSATTFSQADGMIHHTTQVDHKKTSCGAFATSGHATWNTQVRYGNLTVVAAFFPGPEAQVNSSTGFIGLDSSGNVGSITMGFHGKGWPGYDGPPYKYQHGIYADSTKSHHREYTDTGKRSIAEMNTYGLLWTKDKVEWSFNGEIVRTFDKAKDVPQMAMGLRLHSRTGYGDEFVEGGSFTAQFRSFRFTPL
jgi:hypothetical protein